MLNLLLRRKACGYGDALQQVASEMDPAALPDASLQLPADRLGQPRVSYPSGEGFAYGDHQLDARKASLPEVGDELRPEGLALAIAP